jgi:hypothetical protein
MMKEGSVLNIHGKTKDCAQWVIDTYGEAAKESNYQNNQTMQMWIKQSQEVLDD